MIKSKKTTKKIYSAILYVLLLGGGFIVLYPLVFMVMAGFFTAEEYNFTALGLFPIAQNPTFKNFLVLFNPSLYANVSTYMLNSVIRTVIYTAGTVITTLLCGYAFSRLRFRGKKTIFYTLLFTSMMPATMTLIPTFLMYARWPFAGGNMVFTGGSGILNSWAVYFIGLPAVNIMGTFFVKQYIESVPEAIDQAAKVDGAGTLRIIFQIIMPVIKPALGYIIITTALGIWNDWNTGFFFTDDDKLLMLPSAISRLASQAAGAIPDYPQMLTLGLMLTIPSLLIYFIFQKFIIECVAMAGVKG